MSDRTAARAAPSRRSAPRSTAQRTTAQRTTAQRTGATAPGTTAPPTSGRAAPPGAQPGDAVLTAPARTGATSTRPARRPRPSATRRAPFVLLVVALLVGTTLGLLILNTAIAVDSLKATRLQAENAERAQEVQRLERRVVTGGSPAEIAGAAVAAGLIPAGPAAYLVIAPDGTVTLRGTPEPAVPEPTPESPDED